MGTLTKSETVSLISLASFASCAHRFKPENLVIERSNPSRKPQKCRVCEKYSFENQIFSCSCSRTKARTWRQKQRLAELAPSRKARGFWQSVSSPLRSISLATARSKSTCTTATGQLHGCTFTIGSARRMMLVAARISPPASVVLQAVSGGSAAAAVAHRCRAHRRCGACRCPPSNAAAESALISTQCRLPCSHSNMPSLARVHRVGQGLDSPRRRSRCAARQGGGGGHDA